MVDTAVPRISIGWTLLVQVCVIEVVSIIFFTQVVVHPFPLLAAIIAPLCAIAYPLSELPLWSALRHPFVVVVTCVAALLLAGTLIAWLRFRSRLWAHIALVLYSLLSMFVMIGFAI